MCLMSLKGNFQWCDTFMYQNITQLKELQLLKKKKKKDDLCILQRKETHMFGNP